MVDLSIVMAQFTRPGMILVPSAQRLEIIAGNFGLALDHALNHRVPWVKKSAPGLVIG